MQTVGCCSPIVAVLARPDRKRTTGKLELEVANGRLTMRALFLATTLILGVAETAVAQDHKAQVTTSDSIQWGPAPPTLPKGAQMAVLAGDPGKAGPFTLRLKAPAGYKIPAHQHPSAEAVTIISGESNFGMGDKLDEAKAQKLGPGGFIDLPANMNHFAFTTTESIIQISSGGPFSIKYVNPADDPSKTQ
jgi:quercetin dioxygenase-like cupin family protein